MIFSISSISYFLFVDCSSWTPNHAGRSIGALDNRVRVHNMRVGGGDSADKNRVLHNPPAHWGSVGVLGVDGVTLPSVWLPTRPALQLHRGPLPPGTHPQPLPLLLGPRANRLDQVCPLFSNCCNGCHSYHCTCTSKFSRTLHTNVRNYTIQIIRGVPKIKNVKKPN